MSTSTPSLFAQINNDGSVLGGFLTNYVLVFTNAVYLRQNSWFRLQFPIDFASFGNIQCDLALNSLPLSCSIQGQVLYINGLTFPLFPGTQRIKLKNIYNPYIKGLTNPFIFESLEPGINTVVEYYEIMGVSIQPGLIKNPVISAYPLNKNLYIDYTISFTPTNSIPAGGFIKIIFPPQFGVLATICRVIKGLSAGTNPISCPVTGYEVKIMDFAKALSQFIQIKVFATNPAVSGVATSQFTITSYKSATEIIDENLQAGSIIVQNIDKPYYLYIDLYTKIINTTMGIIGPLDFRLYPQSANTLPATTTFNTVARTGKILLQIPLWWKNYGDTYSMNTPSIYPSGYSPLCYFGEVYTKCTHSLQMYKIPTPTDGDLSRYSTSLGGCPVGLGECDVPISIQNVRVSPIPGRWDFRVLTFIDQPAVNPIPSEQDLFTMDIPYDIFTSATVYTTSIDQNDENNIIRVSFQVGLILPWEGAINLNLTVIDEVYKNSAGWPVDLGFGIGEESTLLVPCRIKISNVVVGYAASSAHPNAKCFLFSGKVSTTTNTILQVRGFSSNIASGTNIEVDIPDVKYCNTLNMNCYIELTTSYTTSLKNPYTLNYYRASMGSVTGPSIFTASDSSTFNVIFDKTEICLQATYTFKMNLALNLVKDDHILVKFPNFITSTITTPATPNPKEAFNFARFGITSNKGRVDVIWNFITNEIYYLIKLSGAFSSGTAVTFTLSPIRNPTYHSAQLPLSNFPSIDLGIIIKQLYWSKKRYSEEWTYPITSAWTDGGISNTKIMILPNTLNSDAYTRTIDLKSWVTHRVEFVICHEIPAAGAVKITIPFNDNVGSPNSVYYDGADTTCKIWSGLVGKPVKLGNSMTCVRIDDYYVIKGFENVLQFQTIKVLLKLKSKTIAITQIPIFKVQTFFDSSLALTAGQPNQNDFMVSANEINAALYTGPKSFPPYLEWGEFIKKRIRARKGDRGPLFLTLTTNYDIKNANNASPGKFFVRFDPNMVVGMPANGVLECRIDGYLAKSCKQVTDAAYSYSVEMKMPLTFSITLGVPCLMMISSRNADESSTLKEGLLWGKAGLFEIKIESVDSSNTILEYSKKTIEVFPEELTNFWVWSASKMRSKTSAVTDTAKECSYLSDVGNTEVQCGLTFIRASFQFPQNLAASDSANKPIIIVEFARTNLPNYINGFEKDLGTGLSHRDEIPCYISGISALASATSVVCKLYYGTWPNPTRVFITEFDAVLKNTAIEIHIPKIFNPNITLELVAVSVRAQETVSGKTNPLFQAQYTLVNTTYEYPTYDYPEVILETLNSPAYDVTFTTATIDTSSDLNIKFKSSNYDLQPTDVIAWEIPSGWQLNDPCSHGFTSIASTCESYKSCNWVVLNMNTVVGQTTVQSGTISMTSPPFTYISAAAAGRVKAYIYSHSKLIYILTYPIFSQIMSAQTIVTKTITTTDNVIDGIGEYSIKATIPKRIPQNGAIRITLPNVLIETETNCRNDVIAGSQLNDLGFECVFFTETVATITTSYYIIKLGGFELAAGDQILIKANFKNPSTAQATSWTIQTFYLYEPILNLLMCEVKNVEGPSIVNPSTGSTVTYWDNQHRTQKSLHVTDIGSIQIVVTFTNSIAHNVAANTVSDWYVIVKMSSTFTLQYGSQVQATWNLNEAYLTTISVSGGFNIIKIHAPQNVDVDSGKFIYLNLTSLNAYDGKNGFKYPNTQGIYPFTVSLYDQANVLKETGVVNLFVPGTDFTLYSSSTLIINAGYKTLFTIKFKPKTAVSVGGYLIFYIPTVVEFTNEPLYDNDLGSDLKDGDAIACNSISGFAGILSCVLSFGNQNSGKEASIKITGFTTALAISTLYVLRIQQIKNPVETTATDTKEVFTRLESYTSAAVLINSGVCYDFTIATVTPLTDIITSPTLDMPTMTSSLAGATGVKFGVNLKFPYRLAYNNQNDYFVVEFPKPIFPTLSTTTFCSLKSAAACTLASAYNWVIYKPAIATDNIAPSTTNALDINNGNQALYNDNTGIFLKGYVITKRILRAFYYFKKFATALTTDTIAITMTATTPDIDITLIPKSTTIKYLISITIPSGTGANDVPAGGLIDIEFPINFVLESFCQNDISSQMTAAVPGDITCVKTPDATKHTNAYYAIGGYQKIPTASVIKIVAYAKTPSAAASSLTFSVYIYADTARTQQMYTDSFSFPSVQGFTGFKQLHIPDQGRTPYAIRKNGQSFFQFQLIPAITFVYMRLSFPTISSVTLETNSRPICYFSGYEASYCKSTVLSDTSLALNIKKPHTPATFVSSTIYTMTIDTTCGTKNGLIFGAAGEFKAKVEFSTDGSTFLQSTTFIFNVLSENDFTSASMIMLWANKLTSSPLIVKLQPGAAEPIPVDGKIVVTFPTMNNLRMNLFKANLGYTTQKFNGDTIDCYSASSNMVATNGEIICKLFYLSQNPYIEVSGFNQITGSIEFLIPKIEIPDISTDEGYADLKLHTEDSSGNILNERVIFDVVSAQTYTTTSVTAVSNSITASEIRFLNIPIRNTMSPSSGGRIVFVFPSMYSFDNSIAISFASSTGGTLHACKNILIYTSPAAGIIGGASVVLTLGFSGINSMLSSYFTNTVLSYVIYNRIYVGRHTTTLGALVANPVFSTFSFKVSNVFTSAYSDYHFVFQPSVSLPAKSKIKITFSAAWTFDRIQVISGLTGPFTFGSASTSSIYIILSNAYALSNGNIVIRLTTRNPSTGAAYTVSVAIYADFAESYLIQQSSTQSITIVNLPTATFSQNCFATLIERKLTIKVLPNAGTTLATGFDVRIYGLSGLNAATGKINGDSFTVTLDAIENYYKMSTTTALLTANTFEIDDTVGADTKNVAYSYVVLILSEGTSTYYEACPTSSALYATVATATSQFTTSAVEYGHNGASYYNYLAFTVNAPSALSFSSTTGIYLSFSNGFMQDVGYVLSSGDYVPCAISGHWNLKCVLSSRTSNYNGETKIYLQNFNTISSGSPITICFYRIKNPISEGPHFVRLAYYSNSDYLYDKIIAYVDHIVMATVSAVSQTFIPITATPNTYQSVITSTTTLSMSNQVNSGDKVLFFVDHSNSVRSYISPAATPTPAITVSPSGQLNCVWHQFGQMIICYVLNTVSNYQITITNYENPMHYMEGNAFKSFAISNDNLVEIVYFTNSFTTNVFSQVVLKALDATNTLNSRFYFEMTPSSSIPKGGCLTITFSSGFTAPTLSNFDVLEGTYQGTITSYFIGNQLYLKGFDYIYGGYVLKFIATIKGGAGTGSSSIIITSYATWPENIGVYPNVIDKNTGLTLALSSTVTTMSAWPLYQYIMGYSKKATSSQSFISLKFMPTQDMTVANLANFLMIQLKDGTSDIYTLPTSITPLRCRFNLVGNGYSPTKSYSSQRCYISTDNKYIVVQPPISTTIYSTIYYELMIFFAEIDIQSGFQTSGTNSNYKMGVNILSDENTPSSSNRKEFNTAYFKNILAQSGSGCVKSFISDKSKKNLLHFDIKIANPISDYLEILLPLTRIYTDTTADTLYTQTLGSTLTTLSNFYCNFGAAFPVTTVCSIWYGQSGTENRPTRITISGFGSLGTNTVLSFDIANLMNPATISVFTHAVFYSYSLAATTFANQFKDFFYFPFVTYSTEKATAASTNTATFPSPSVLTIDSSMTLTLPVLSSQVTLSTLEEIDGFLLTYDPNFYDPLNTSPSGTIAASTMTSYFMTKGSNLVNAG